MTKQCSVVVQGVDESQLFIGGDIQGLKAQGACRGA